MPAYTVLLRMATPRFTRPQHTWISAGTGRTYRHRRRPLRASTAEMESGGSVRYKMPSTAIGVVSK